MSKVVPINGHLIVKLFEEEGAFQTSQRSFELRGEVLENGQSEKIKNGQVVFFDSWTAAKYIDSQGAEFWVIPESHVRAMEV